jgi:hypothetical protein
MYFDTKKQAVADCTKVPLLDN